MFYSSIFLLAVTAQKIQTDLCAVALNMHTHMHICIYSPSEFVVFYFSHC